MGPSRASTQTVAILQVPALCVAVARGDLEQIQFLLGNPSVQTTERYVGCAEVQRCLMIDSRYFYEAGRDNPVHQVGDEGFDY
jgi:hypothetical protein